MTQLLSYFSKGYLLSRGLRHLPRVTLYINSKFGLNKKLGKKAMAYNN